MPKKPKDEAEDKKEQRKEYANTNREIEVWVYKNENIFYIDRDEKYKKIRSKIKDGIDFVHLYDFFNNFNIFGANGRLRK